MYARSLGQSSYRCASVLKGSNQASGESWRLAGAVMVPKGMPRASTAVERLVPRFPLSTGFLPAFSPPHGDLVMAAIHRHVREFQPDEAVVGFKRQLA